jgi:hypothetical protein
LNGQVIVRHTQMQTSSVAAKGIPIRKAPLPALSSSNLPASFSTNGPSIVPRDKKGLAAGKALSSPSLPCASSSSAEFNDLIPHHQQPFHFASCHSAHHHEPIHNIDDKEQDVGDLVFDDLFISKETTTPTFRTTTSTSSSSSSSSTSTTCTSTPGSHHRHHHQRQPSTINSGSEGEDSSSLTEGAGSEGEDNGGGEGFEHDSGDDDDRHHLGEEDGEESEEVGPSHYLDLETSKVDLNDFTLLKLIGQGGYGKVPSPSPHYDGDACPMASPSNLMIRLSLCVRRVRRVRVRVVLCVVVVLVVLVGGCRCIRCRRRIRSTCTP